MALLDLEKGVVWSQFEVVTCRQVINIMTALLLPAIVTTVVIFRGLVCQKRGLDIHPHAIHPHHQSPTLHPNVWKKLRPRYSNYRRRTGQPPLFVGRCSQCSKGFFKLDGVCAKCPVRFRKRCCMVTI